MTMGVLKSKSIVRVVSTGISVIRGTMRKSDFRINDSIIIYSSTLYPVSDSVCAERIAAGRYQAHASQLLAQSQVPIDYSHIVYFLLSWSSSSYDIGGAPACA